MSYHYKSIFVILMQEKMRKHISLWDSEPDIALKSFGWSDAQQRQKKFLIVSETSVILCTNVWAINCLLGKVSVYQYGASCQNDCNLYNSCQIIHLFYPTKKTQPNW